MSAEAATLQNQSSGDETYEGFAYEEEWQVFTTDPTDTGAVVLTAANLPSFGAPFDGDPLARVSSRRPQQQLDSRLHWRVSVRYSREKGNQEDKQQPPTLRPVKRSASIRWVEMALMQDVNGDPIVTSAKTPFNPPLVVSMPHPVVRFVRWEQSFSTATIRQYAGKVNSADFGIYVAGEVLCTNIEATEEWEQDADGNPTKFWMVTYEFEACNGFSDQWRPMRVLDADYWFIDPADSKRKPIFVDKDGTYHGDPDNANGATPIPSPVPLEGALGNSATSTATIGNVLQAVDLPDFVNYLNFDIYEEVDFNDLNLPVD